MSLRRRRAARRGHDDTSVDLNLVSLIDVFTILIFFLLASSGPVELFSPPPGVQLPRVADLAVAPAAQTARDGVELAVDGQQLRVQGQLVATLDDAGLAPLREALRAQAQPGRPLMVLADRELPWHWVGALMREAAAAGLDQVSFAVRPERS